ncbi:MAG: biopolymer transporter ExbD [Pirellulales bacterium]
MARSLHTGRGHAPAKVDVQLTPMIDVVFQLLAFFLVTFRVAAVEGDFNLRLPHADRLSHGTDGPDKCVIRLTANDRGDLGHWRLNHRMSGQGAASLHLLRSELRGLVNAAHAADQEPPEFELRADRPTRYEHMLAAIEALGGPEFKGVKLRIARSDE